jgi:hypothetical protein
MTLSQHRYFFSKADPFGQYGSYPEGESSGLVMHLLLK